MKNSLHLFRDFSSKLEKFPEREQSTPVVLPCVGASPAMALTGVVKQGCASPMESGQAGHETWIVHTSKGHESARCAASCLLEPQLNDVVSLSLNDGKWWITAVLVTASRERAILRVSGVRELALRAPMLMLQAQQSCHIDSPVLALETPQLEVRARTMRLTVSILQVVVRSLTVMAQRVNSFSDQLNSNCRVRTVQVDEVDSLSVRHAVTTAETSSLQAGQVLVNARDTVRVDGARIMMG